MLCNNCQVRPAQRLCGACAFVPYCSELCSEQDWIAHAVEAHIGEEGKEAVANEILPGLWLGGIKALHHLEEMKVGAVVTAIQQDKPGVEKMLTKKVGARPHLRFKWYDSPDQPLTVQELCRAVSFIDQYLAAGGGVLVHCWAGHSRSVAIVVFYLMKKVPRFKTVADALAFIQSKRPYISPNEGFVAQLETLITKQTC